MRTKHPMVSITVEVLPDERDPDGHHRLKRLLKYAGRALRLKCRRVVLVKDKP